MEIEDAAHTVASGNLDRVGDAASRGSWVFGCAGRQGQGKKSQGNEHARHGGPRFRAAGMPGRRCRE